MVCSRHEADAAKMKEPVGPTPGPVLPPHALPRFLARPP